LCQTPEREPLTALLMTCALHLHGKSCAFIADHFQTLAPVFAGGLMASSRETTAPKI
jgi:hypothetical protein